jgi:hypothetical protein
VTAAEMQTRGSSAQSMLGEVLSPSQRRCPFLLSRSRWPHRSHGLRRRSDGHPAASRDRPYGRAGRKTIRRSLGMRVPGRKPSDAGHVQPACGMLALNNRE